MHVGAMDDFERLKPWLMGATLLIVAAAVFFLGHIVYEDEAAWQDTLSAFLEQARGTPWALPLVCLVYVLGSAVLFPIILMNLVCAMVFGLWGIAYALIGAMLNAAVYFGIGYYVRHKHGGKKWLTHPKIAPVDKKIQNAGLAGIVLIHTLPAPPFTVTNLIGGLSSVNFPTFMAGTFIALLPGAIARGIVGDSLTKIILNPTPDTYAYLALGITLWIGLAYGMHAFLKKFAPAAENA